MSYTVLFLPLCFLLIFYFVLDHLYYYIDNRIPSILNLIFLNDFLVKLVFVLIFHIFLTVSSSHSIPFLLFFVFLRSLSGTEERRGEIWLEDEMNGIEMIIWYLIINYWRWQTKWDKTKNSKHDKYTRYGSVYYCMGLFHLYVVTL